MKTVSLLLAVAMPPAVAAGGRVTIYVDAAAGRDAAAADGTDLGGGWAGWDPRRPLRTLGAAQRAARVALGNGARGVTVRAAAGRYAPLSLGAHDSGGDGAEVRYEGASGAVISAGATLPASGFHPAPPTDPISGRLPAGAQATTRRFDLGAMGISASELSSGDPTGVVLTCEGATVSLASWPSNGSWAHTGAPVGASGFVYPADAPIPAAADGLWLAGYFVYDWADSRIPVERVVASNRTLFATTQRYVKSTGHFIPDARFRFLNLPEFLGAGQFWLSNTTGHLYLRTQQPQPQPSCTLAVGRTALQVANTSHISVSGFTLESAQSDVATISDSHFIRVRNCTVRDGGVSGIAVSGGSHVEISDVEVSAIGGTGISVIGGDRPTLTRGNHSVSNCTVHDFAKVLWCYHPGIEMEGVGNVASGNEIYNAPHQGIRKMVILSRFVALASR